MRRWITSLSTSARVCKRRSSSGIDGGSTRCCDIAARFFTKLLRTLPIDIKTEHRRPARSALSTAGAACRSNGRTPQPTPGGRRLFTMASKRPAVDEMIVAPIDFAAPLRPRRHRERSVDARSAFSSDARSSVVLPAPDANDKTSMRPGARYSFDSLARCHFCPPPAMAYSNVRGLARGNTVLPPLLSSNPMFVSSTSFALAHNVLASRLSSCARKSSRLPTLGRPDR